MASGELHGTVLVADGELERGQRLLDACSGLGLRCRFAPHGAAALEAALAEVPEVLVAPLALPLIDAAKLHEILRANPRTQAVRVVLLADLPSGAREQSAADAVLPCAAPAEEVARRVEAILAQRVRLEGVERGAQQDREVEGKLAQIPLSDLLQLLHLNRKTGTIDLSRRGADGRETNGRVFVRDGNVVQARVAAIEGEKALYRLLAWRAGSFAFSQTRVVGPQRIEAPTRALLMEGMRQLDEWERMRPRLPALDARITLKMKTSELPNIVHPLTQEVLLLLELYTSVHEVVDHCSYPDYQVLRTLQTLVDRGIVELRSDSAPTSAAAGEGFFSPAQARRLREWITNGSAATATPGDAKLLVVSPDVAVTHDFLRLLRGVPGLSLEPAFASARFSGDALMRMARVPVDQEVGVELYQIPAGERCAAVWPVAGHGALGALLLLAGPVADAGRALAPVAEALRGLPRARLFHVLLLRKEERALPEELRENLSLLDEASLFLLPLEGGKDPAALLRMLFARVLP